MPQVMPFAARRTRCGAVLDPEDDEILSRMMEWCQAWKLGPAHPSRALPKGRVPRKEDTVSQFGPGPTQRLDRVGGNFEEDWAPLRELIRQKREHDESIRDATAVGAVPRRRNEVAAAHGVGLSPGKPAIRFGKETQALRETESGQAGERRRRLPRRTSAKRAEELQDLTDRTVPPTALMFGGGSAPSTSGMPASYQTGEVEGDKLRVMLKAAADSTNKTYDSAWRQWVNFSKVRGKTPLLTGGGNETMEEDELLTFAVYTTGVLNLSYSTMKTRLMAIRAHHLRAGCKDPLMGKERLWLFLRGLKRLDGAVVRKFPVTPEMLRWVHDYLSPVRPDGSVDRGKEPRFGSHRNDTAVWSALRTGFFWLLRSSEYLANDGVGFASKKCVTGNDAQLYDDRATLYLKGSKTDQYNLGCIRSHSRSEDPSLCPVVGLEDIFRQFPERCAGKSESHLPLFRFEDGSPILRSLVQGLLEMAATALGLPPGRFGSHSLRIGGATAMYHLCREVETVKRFGRWASGSFSLYLWEADDAADGLARGMVASEGRLEASHGLGASVSRQQVEEKRVRFALGGEVAAESGGTLSAGGAMEPSTASRLPGMDKPPPTNAGLGDEAVDEPRGCPKVGEGVDNNDLGQRSFGDTTADGWDALREHLQLLGDGCTENVFPKVPGPRGSRACSNCGQPGATGACRWCSSTRSISTSICVSIMPSEATAGATDSAPPATPPAAAAAAAVPSSSAWVKLR